MDIPSRYVTSQLGYLSLASPGVAKSSTRFGWDKGWNESEMFRVLIDGRVVNYTVSQKNGPPLTCYHLDIRDPIVIIFGRSVAEEVRDQMML